MSRDFDQNFWDFANPHQTSPAPTPAPSGSAAAAPALAFDREKRGSPRIQMRRCARDENRGQLHPHLGHEFVDLSPNSRQQLEGMISSLTASKLRLPDAPAKPTLNLPPITQPAAALDAISQHFETKGTPLLRRIRPYSRRQPTGKQRA